MITLDALSAKQSMSHALVERFRNEVDTRSHSRADSPARMRGRAGALAIAILAAVGVLAAPLRTASAQGLVSVGLGVGGGVGDRNHDNSGSDAHALGFVQLHPPLFPVAVRGDALFSKIPDGGAALSLLADAVFLAPLPIVTPYALVGYGKYGVGKDGSASGWNVGVGVRLKVPSFTVFGEARRHKLISHDLLTIGIAL